MSSIPGSRLSHSHGSSKAALPFLLVLLTVGSALPARTQVSSAEEAEKLNKRVVQLFLQGKYAEAVPLARRAAEILKQVAGEDHPDYAVSLNYLALVYHKQRRYGEAEPLFKRVLSIRERALGPEDPLTADSLNNLAVLYVDQGRYVDAEPLLKRALSIREKQLGPDDPAVAASLNTLAELDIAMGRYEEAEPLLKRCLAVREQELGPDHPDVAASLSGLARLYAAQGRYGEAELLYKRTLAMQEQGLGPDHPEVAGSLNSLAWLYIDQGRYGEAESLMTRSLAIRERGLGPDHPDVADTLYGLASLTNTRGQYGKAEPLYKRALAIWEKALGGDDPDVARGLQGLALLYSEQGRYGEAEPLLKRAMAVFERALGPDHPNVAASLSTLANLYGSQGRYGEAEPLLKRALAIYEKALGPDHPDVANCLNSLATLYLGLHTFDEAEPLLKRALAINEKTLGPDHPDVAPSLNNLATLCLFQGRDAEAEAFYRRALAISEKALGPDSPKVAASLCTLGLLNATLGKVAEAEALYKRSLAVFEKAVGPDHPDVAKVLVNLAQMYHEEGLPRQASAFYDRSLAVLGRQFDYYFTYMSEKDRLQFLATVSNSFPVYYSFCLSYRDQLPELAGKMYDVVLWAKGFVAQSVAALRGKIEASGDPEALRMLDRLTGMKNELAKLALAPADPDPQKQAARRARIEGLEKEANELEKELVARSAALGEEKRLERATWQQVRDALKPDEAAVEFVKFPFYSGKGWAESGYYVALVLRRESRAPEVVVLGEQKELERVPLADYRRLVAVPDEEGRRPARLGRAFYSAFWLPLEAKLGAAKRVYVSPDGELNQVSLGVVPGNDGRLLMEACELRTVNSTKDLLRGPVSGAAGEAVLVGNPKFGLGEGEQRSALASSRFETTEAGAAGGILSPRSRDLRGGTLTELPGTELEVEDVSALLRRQKWEVRSYTGPEALEERVKKVRRPRVLHLATHGFFEPDLPRAPIEPGATEPVPMREDPMLRSGIYLAGANRALAKSPPAQDLEDGVLTAYEVSQLNLQGTELVVLSACETGLGKTEAGEGVFGLRRALQVAGAQAVLMSLWSVPDEETRELMALFYAKWLGGEEKHAALREAQLEMREKVKARYGEDLPLFWGAFVLVGR